MKKNRVGWKFDCEQIFHPTFSGSSNKIFMFHPTFHSCDVIANVKTSNFEWFNKTKTLCKLITIKNQTPLLVSCNISFLWRLANVKISNFEWFNKTKTLCKLITIKNQTPVHIKSKWPSTTTNDNLTIYLNYKNMGKNTKTQQKKFKIAEKEKASRPKKVYKGSKKKMFEGTYPLSRFTSA